MKSSFFLLFYLIYLGTYSHAGAQEFESYSYALKDIDQAYIQSSLLVDSDGFLWYSTTNGKVIKDFGGEKLVVPLPIDLKYAPVFTYDIFQDNDKNIWVGCSFGAYIINPYTYESKLLTWKPKNSTLNTGFVDFVQKKDGTIWIATDSNHIISYKDSMFLESYKTPFEEKVENLILALNYNDELVICKTPKDGNPFSIFRITNFQVEHVADLPISTVLFFPLKEQVVNNKKKKDVFYYNEVLSTYTYYPKIKAFAFVIPGNWNNRKYHHFFNQKYSVLKNNIIIEALNHTVKFNKINFKSDTISFIDILNIKISKTAYLSVDKEDKLIIGKSNKITKIRIPKNTIRGITRYLNNDKNPISTRGIVQIPTNSAFVSAHELLQKIKLKNTEESLLIAGYGGGYSLLKESDSILWNFKRSDRLQKINLNTNEKTTYKVPFPSWILENKNKEELWIGANIGLYIFNKKTGTYKDFNQLNDTYNLKNYYIRDILQLPDSTLWIATNDNGIFFYNQKTKDVIHYSKNNPEYYIPHDIVLDIYKDKNNTIWIAGNRGLTRINKNNTIQNYNTNNGLSNTIVCSILETKDYIWAGTYGGINRIAISNNTTTSPKIDHLLYDVEFNHKSSLKKNDSILFFGSIDGVYELNTKQVSFSNSKVNILPVSIKKHDERSDSITEKFIGIKNLKKIDLDYNHNFFEFEFALDNTFDYHKDEYHYMIEGLTPSWVSLGNENIVRQYGIPSGDYILRVTGKNDMGTVSSNTLVIPIHVAQVFYKTSIFIISVNATIISIGLILIYRRQVRKKNELQQNTLIKNLELKALRSQMNPHFIFNTINGIQSDIIFKDTKEVNDHISSFARILRITMDMTTKGAISLQQELEYLEAYIKLQQHRLEHNFLYDIKITSNQYNIENIEIPSMLFQPLVENAIIHGLEPKKENPKSLTLTFNVENNVITGCIEDNGVGRNAFKSNNNYKSHALSIMKNRININNQMKKNNISIETIDKGTIKEPLGTKVILKIPFE